MKISKINSVDRLCRDRVIENQPFVPERLAFAENFANLTQSNANLTPAAMCANSKTQRELIDQVSGDLRRSKNPRAKNEVKAWASDLLKQARQNLSLPSTRSDFSSSGGNSFKANSGMDQSCLSGQGRPRI